MVAIWLHTKKNIPAAVVNMTLKSIRLILQTALEIFGTSLAQQALGITVNLPSFDIPVDIRTLHACFGLEPTIERAIICQSCYTKAAISCPILLVMMARLISCDTF